MCVQQRARVQGRRSPHGWTTAVRWLQKLLPWYHADLCEEISRQGPGLQPKTHDTQLGRWQNLIGKESACNAEHTSSIPGLGRSTGEGTGYPLQNSWASLVAQLVKYLPAVRETWIWSLGWEDPLEKRKATHFSIQAWRILWTVHGVAKSWTQLSDFHFTFTCDF